MRNEVRLFAVVMAWILVIGGVVQIADMLFNSWHLRTFVVGLLSGPAQNVGIGLTLWLLARRG